MPGLLDRVTGWFSRAVMPVQNASTSLSTAYEGAAQTKRTRGWQAPTLSPNWATLPSLAMLRDRSRAAVRNDGYAKGIVDKLVTNIIGTGIKPLSKAESLTLRADIQRLWLRWTDESDADGLLDWYGQQAQITRAWLEGGEVFVRLRPRLASDGLTVPLQVQVIEPELCDHTYNAFAPNSGNRIRASVEFNGIGRRVAYWFYRSRPGDLMEIDTSQRIRVPADSVIHLFDPLRPGQIRGVPHLTQTLIRLHVLDKFDDATLLRQQLANLFAGFVTRQAVPDGAQATNPFTGEDVNEKEARPAIELNPGIFQELDPGEEVTFSDPPDIQGGYVDFFRAQLRSACASAGVPYEVVTGDMSGLNDRVVRVILNEFAGRIEATQHQIIAFQLCRRVWQSWMDRVFLSGALPIPIAYVENPEPWTAVKFTPPRRRYIHPVQDVEAQVKAMRAGLTSRSATVSEYGEDAEAIDAEQAVDNERADDLGLRYDSDGRKAVLGSKPSDDEPEPPPQPNGDAA